MDKKEPQGVVFEELISLRKNIQDVLANLKRLKTRLEPVLYSLESDRTDEEKVKDEASSPLRIRLMEINTMVYEIKKIQNDIDNRLEIGKDIFKDEADEEK